MRSAMWVLILCSLFAVIASECIRNDDEAARPVQLLLGKLVSRCENGVYAAEQCDYAKLECWCVTMAGEEIPNTRIPAQSAASVQRRQCEEERRKFAEASTSGGTVDQRGTVVQTDGRKGKLSNDFIEKIRVRSLRQAAGENTTASPEGANVTVVAGNATVAISVTQVENATVVSVANVTSIISMTHVENATVVQNVSASGSSSVSANVSASVEVSATGNVSTETGSSTPPPSAESNATVTAIANATLSITLQGASSVSGGTTGAATLVATGALTVTGLMNASVTPSSTPPTMENATTPSMPEMSSIGPMMNTTTEMMEMGQTSTPFGPMNMTEMTTPMSMAVQVSNMTTLTMNQNETCGPNTVYSLCATPCPMGCDQQNEEMCRPTTCTPGCVCAPGYIRQHANDTSSPCIKQTSCGEAQVQPPPMQQCQDQNAVWSNCGSPCEETCQFRPSDCPQQCAAGCFCKEGYVKESDTSSKCVPRDQCVQSAQPYQQQCQDPNAVLSNCGSACEETCDTRPTNCTLPCVSGCFCKSGFVKQGRSVNAPCVRRDQCGQMGQGRDEPQCADPNASWSNCATSCPETCKPRPMYCTTPCVPGCLCNEGFVLESRTRNAKCIPRDFCKPQQVGGGL